VLDLRLPVIVVTVVAVRERRAAHEQSQAQDRCGQSLRSAVSFFI